MIVKTLEETPKNATHWSTRSMAAATGMSQSAISRIWRAFGLQPHRAETFKLSKDPLFVDRVRDVVGLYLDPPERALVLCVDEKSQIQALDRSQPVLPMMPGVPERRSHDYVRSGTTTLFAALDTATGKVIGSLHRRHRATEFKKFLVKIDREVPADLEVHLILDKTHKVPVIKKWLAAHPRFHLHFTPTGSSWLNLVERWFAELTTKKLRRGSTAPSRPSNATSAPGSPTGTNNPARSPGQRPLMRSSTKSPPTAEGSPTQDTRCDWGGRPHYSGTNTAAVTARHTHSPARRRWPRMPSHQGCSASRLLAVAPATAAATLARSPTAIRNDPIPLALAMAMSMSNSPHRTRSTVLVVCAVFRCAESVPG